ncbi:subtilase-type protease inhibitor [Couchioplanes caeruleus]|uniref:SSI family serine proteinase inhibitor n=1 Tax=Couchioplanes caeruleus TaxID=56438 RepID=UPI0020BDA6AF|nr:SSI family serine proteinase inhibitor [Couchioplanes caeruleus]UQU63179.1 subtilase-type protease inhibitor [Couchioplanes caeruleus]
MIRTIGLSAVMVLGLASPAVAAVKQSELVLSYEAEAGYAAAVVLRCDPAGGAHPKKGKACQALAKVHGRPEKLRPAKVMCTMEYAPVTARIEGTWHGRPVDWTHTFGNACDMARTMGVVMAF